MYMYIHVNSTRHYVHVHVCTCIHTYTVYNSARCLHLTPIVSSDGTEVKYIHQKKRKVLPAASDPHSPDSYSEHGEQVSALQPAQEHDPADDEEGVEGQLLAESVHALLERRLGALLSLHHAKHTAKL